LNKLQKQRNNLFARLRIASRASKMAVKAVATKEKLLSEQAKIIKDQAERIVELEVQLKRVVGRNLQYAASIKESVDIGSRILRSEFLSVGVQTETEEVMDVSEDVADNGSAKPVDRCSSLNVSAVEFVPKFEAPSMVVPVPKPLETVSGSIPGSSTNTVGNAPHNEVAALGVGRVIKHSGIGCMAVHVEAKGDPILCGKLVTRATVVEVPSLHLTKVMKLLPMDIGTLLCVKHTRRVDKSGYATRVLSKEEQGLKQ